MFEISNCFISYPFRADYQCSLVEEELHVEKRSVGEDVIARPEFGEWLKPSAPGAVNDLVHQGLNVVHSTLHWLQIDIINIYSFFNLLRTGKGTEVSEEQGK